ncbi:MAG: TIGR00159 family protein, partial [Bacteroidetes bacterium HGW-Bacteroidetes-15]
MEISLLTLFISIRVLDVIDIILVALLFYQIYMLIRGTVAINIFMGIFILYLIWLIVRALNMELLSSILGQIIGVGVIALIIVFQQEIRRFLLLIGTRYFSKNRFSLERFLMIKGEK